MCASLWRAWWDLLPQAFKYLIMERGVWPDTSSPHAHPVGYAYSFQKAAWFWGVILLKYPRPGPAHPWSWSKDVLNLWWHQQGESHRRVGAAADPARCSSAQMYSRSSKKWGHKLICVISSPVVAWLWSWRIFSVTTVLQSVFKYKWKPEVKNSWGCFG